ncbi:MAG: hypothetical protein GX993_07620 [Bacteroidales bacterium]|nr:hypothetical protein [Bacteroidales bacterium]
MSTSKINGRVIVLLLLAAALYVSAFFTAPKPMNYDAVLPFGNLEFLDALFGATTLSYILSISFLIIIAVSIYAFNLMFTTGINYLLPVLYVFLAVNNPRVIFFSPLHIVALLLLWALVFSARYRSSAQNLSDNFLSFFLYGAAVIFFPPLVWIFPLVVLINLRATEEKIKYIFTSFFGMITPLVMVCAVCYVVGGNEFFKGLGGSFWTSMSAVGRHDFDFSAVEIATCLVIISFTLISIFYLLRHLNRYKIIHSNTAIRIIIFAVLITLICALFLTDNHDPYGVVLFVPVSLILFEYLSSPTNNKGATIFYTVVAGLAIISRIIVFVR